MREPRKLAVTGGTGFVGSALLDLALEQGHPLRALARRVPEGQRKGLVWVSGSLSDREALTRLVRGTEAVIHVAGLTTSTDPADLERANTAGTLAMIEAAKAAGIRRFLFVSSLAAREPELSAYGKTKRQAERIVAASGLDWTVVRPPAVYGPRDTEMFELFRAARMGVVPMPPEGRASLLHVRDLARLLLALLPSSEEVTSAVFEPDDATPGGWSHGELARLIGRAVERKPFVPHLSKGALFTLSRLDELFRGGKAKLTGDRVRYMVHPDWVSHPDRRVPAAIWKPEIATEQGMRQTAEWYRQEGWL